MSDATRLFECFVPLLDKRPPGFNYRTELQLEDMSPASNNKAEGAVCAYALDSLNHRDDKGVQAALNYEIRLLAQPFMRNEAATKEPVYRALPAYAHSILVGVAIAAGRSDAYEAARLLARSHVAWLALGVGIGPGRQIVDHKHQDARRGTVLVGTAKPKNRSVRHVAQAGMRWWVRDRENGSGDFQFVNDPMAGTILEQALGKSGPRAAKTQNAVWLAQKRRFAEVLPFGLLREEVEILRRFIENPGDEELAAIVVTWALPFRNPYRIDRFEDGSVVTALEEDSNSSTDPVSIDACYASDFPEVDGCEIRIASPADGVRREEGRCLARAESDAYACWKEGSNQIIRVPRPPGALAYSVLCDGRAVRLVDPTPPPHVTPPESDHGEVNPGRPKPRGLGSSL